MFHVSSGVGNITLREQIVRALVFWFEALDRPVQNMKMFEEGIFSDLFNLKPDANACLDELEREKMGLEPATRITGEPALSFVYGGTKSLHEQFDMTQAYKDVGDRTTNMQEVSKGPDEKILVGAIDEIGVGEAEPQHETKAIASHVADFDPSSASSARLVGALSMKLNLSPGSTVAQLVWRSWWIPHCDSSTANWRTILINSARVLLLFSSFDLSPPTFDKSCLDAALRQAL
ncbi:hypothetical protein DFH07DRAFT_974391 [Mycena maculata]|uniref:Uncharacterized protein n=1 Tax=Mycena maculata TaxID=230809 RepID=A0AAD7H820_9AGAR|nr:hypothetical protein DFH07DRAFT_974391 [Mycena maculata]